LPGWRFAQHGYLHSVDLTLSNDTLIVAGTGPWKMRAREPQRPSAAWLGAPALQAISAGHGPRGGLDP
jgi:hypothetical protein